MYSSTTGDRIAPTSYLSRMFSIVQYDKLRFLILDCPSDSTLPSVIKILSREHVTDVVRVCEPTYNREPLTQLGIHVHDMAFKDGGTPPSSVLNAFLSLVHMRFYSSGSDSVSSNVNGPTPLTPISLPASPALSTSSLSGHSGVSNVYHASSPFPGSTASTPSTIAVHCVAGLGRAPVLIAIALIEAGMSPLDAIEYVRARRRGAFNTAQVKYLDAYKSNNKLLDLHSHHGILTNGSVTKRTSSPRLLASFSRATGRPRSATTSPDSVTNGQSRRTASPTLPLSVFGPDGFISCLSTSSTTPSNVTSTPSTPVVSTSTASSSSWAHKLSKVINGFSSKRHSSTSALAKAPADVAAHP